MLTSLEKLRLKEDEKLKRKIQKKEAKKLAQERMEEDLRESNPPKTEEQKGMLKSKTWKEEYILALKYKHKYPPYWALY